ncbi:MAG: hypothetical protein ACK5P7_04995 [Bdellovibrio sp.]
MIKVECTGKKLTGVALLLIALTGCQTFDRSNQYVRRDDQAPLVDEKYSLKADRQKMEELRQDVPAERRRQNDEVAFALQMFQEVRRSPQEIRTQFDSAVRKKRELLNRDLQKEREQFTRAERAKRDNFLKDQKNSREAFLKSKPNKDQRDDMFKDQELKRRDFFADEREKRGDYESDVRERRKSFEDYVRERQGEFTQEYRVYSRKYDDLKREQQLRGRDKAKEAPSSSPSNAFRASPENLEAEDLRNEIEALKQHPGTKLESGND